MEIQNEKNYTQSDVDNITEKVRNTEAKRYTELESKYNALEKQNKELIENYSKVVNLQDKMLYDSNKAQFVNNGGKSDAFDAFYQINKDVVNNGDVDWNNIKQTQDFFFNQETIEAPSVDKTFFDIKPEDMNWDIDAERAKMDEEIKKNTRY